MMSSEPQVRAAPEPLRLDPVRTTELVCSDLDLSVTLTPERPAGRCRRQVCFSVSPQRSGHSEQELIPEPRNHQPTAKDEHGHGLENARVWVRGGEPLTEGAELNSTLALGAELQEVENQVFDPEKAVRVKLQSSSLTKNHISSKAAEGLNFPRSQLLYRALVSVSQSREQLISQALQDRPALAPPTATLTNKFPSQPLEAPELLQFYSPDKLLRETPLLPGDRISMPRPRPVPRPAHTTFHLHHRHKLWES
ncbi:protein phosphatase 1 regulatory subunit 35-like isoform X1 [Sinocyclocheilus rhinocerous]|uniref:Protein phosphatase 1 regulatory subunit 35-like n=1 Tax=Sinocyclocheilus rhinocerous TaxID=307959 RepID=A0A673GM91_9TELE|nr:PREDICTED: protein phosphatase 1 regulatory subunit 35-like isoform X1 [Sinocyclocheilus rhinocerous]XP_016405083.1 PREDICTED: protein phosphatase 1 regulatory subunit 35-like isoform X1 [Sinocyclocheilus rhinocerous]